MPRTLTALLGTLVLATVMNHATPAATNQADRFVTTAPNVRLHIIDAGPASAQPLLLIPGWCFGADIWAAQLTALSDTYRVIAIDPRSQGASSIVVSDNSPDTRAADIAALLRQLNLHKPVLIGWSQGVQDVAAYILAQGTDELAGVVLVDAPISGGSATMDQHEAAETLERMALYVHDPRAYLVGMMHYVFRRAPGEPERTHLVAEAMRTPTSIGVSNLVLDLYARDYRPALARIRVPTLLVTAGTAPDRRAQLEQPIADVTHYVAEQAGHAVFHDEPEEFNRQLREFLRKRIARFP